MNIEMNANVIPEYYLSVSQGYILQISHLSPYRGVWWTWPDDEVWLCT